MSGRRRRRPLERRWHPTDSRSTALPHLMLREEIDDERQLEEAERPTRPCRSSTFHFSSPALCAYCAPPSYMRRFMPARPWMNIGMNTMLMQMNDPQK